MLISDDEWEMLQALADRTGITASDWVRMQIRQVFADGPPLKVADYMRRRTRERSEAKTKKPKR